jgi:hypothetical protein
LFTGQAVFLDDLPGFVVCSVSFFGKSSGRRVGHEVNVGIDELLEVGMGHMMISGMMENCLVMFLTNRLRNYDLYFYS